MTRPLLLFLALLLTSLSAHADPTAPPRPPVPPLRPVRVITTRIVVPRLAPVAGDTSPSPGSLRCVCTGYLVFVNEGRVEQGKEMLRQECTADFDPAIIYSLRGCDSDPSCTSRCMSTLQSLATGNAQVQACIKKIGGAGTQESHVTGKCQKDVR